MSARLLPMSCAAGEDAGRSQVVSSVRSQCLGGRLKMGPGPRFSRCVCSECRCAAVENGALASFVVAFAPEILARRLRARRWQGFVVAFAPEILARRLKGGALAGCVVPFAPEVVAWAVNGDARARRAAVCVSDRRPPVYGDPFVPGAVPFPPSGRPDRLAEDAGGKQKREQEVEFPLTLVLVPLTLPLSRFSVARPGVSPAVPDPLERTNMSQSAGEVT
jgi:hypothetical protein